MTYIKVTATATARRVSVMECQRYDNQGKALDYKFIDIQALKEAGVIKRADSCKKAEIFLNTPEGMKFYQEAHHMKIF
ncbi:MULTISPECIES: hypothetical protein [Bacillaceae]|uniref:hypothetical protein n=1 Tax=Bacillaceae TaxID=186817 RepID=UPI002352D78C|nr:hypothetical protein [Bacillus weihaiensis]